MFDIVGKESPAIKGMDVKDAEDNEVEEIFSGTGSPKPLVAGSSKGVFRTPYSRSSSRASASKVDCLRALFFKCHIPLKRSTPIMEEEEEIDLNIKKAKLELVRAQLEGQNLLNEQHRLTIERMRDEVVKN